MIKRLLRNILVRPQLWCVVQAVAWDNDEDIEIPRKAELLNNKGIGFGAIAVFHIIITVAYLAIKEELLKMETKFRYYEDTKAGQTFDRLVKENRHMVNLTVTDRAYIAKKLIPAFKKRLKKDFGLEPWWQDKIKEHIKFCEKELENIRKEALILGLAGVKE